MCESAPDPDGRVGEAKRTDTYGLTFDRRVPYGSAEHFFHFMWGYLLPSVHAIHELARHGSRQFLFRSCGPVMDAITREVASLFQYQSRIVPETDLEHDDCRSRLQVPRWDIGVLQPHLFDEHGTRSLQAMRMLEELDKHESLRELLRRNSFTSGLSDAVAQVKSMFLQRLDALDHRSDSAVYDGCYLLLARSPCPDFYVRQGPAEHHGYGTSRRVLRGLDEAEKWLRDRNIPVRVYEPGRFTLTAQIRVFRRCRGIIGIKGAEFANMIWLAPDSKVILLKPAGMNSPPVQRCLAELLRLDYTEVGVHGRKIDFTPEMVQEYLSAAPPNT